MVNAIAFIAHRSLLRFFLDKRVPCAVSRCFDGVNKA